MPNVKPGVSARAEVIVTNLQNVITVPIQAVTTRKGQQVVYLANAPNRSAPVSVGMYNIKLIEIVSGLQEGDQVLLSPPSDTEEKDLAGSIISEGDVLPPSATNVFLRISPRGGEGGRSGGGGRREPGQRGAEGGGSGNGGVASGRRGEDAGGPGGQLSREERMKQFDVNGDGQLDDSERAAMRERLGGQGRGLTNSTADPASGRADGSR
jgi:hypothetical protein